MYSMDAQVSPVNQNQCRGPLWVSLLHGVYSVQDLTFGVSVLIVYRFLRCLTNQLLSFFASVWRPPNKIWFYFSLLTPCFRISPVLSGLVQQSWFGWMHKYQYIWHSFLCQDYFCSLVCPDRIVILIHFCPFKKFKIRRPESNKCPFIHGPNFSDFLIL